MKGLREQRLDAVKRLLRLFNEEELVALSESLEIPSGSDLTIITQTLAELPRFRALQLALDAAVPTVTMLQDITTFLEKHGVSARTTGFVLSLEDPARPGSIKQFDLSAQEVSEVCSFCPKTLQRIGDDPFNEAYDSWESLKNDWSSLIRRSRPDFTRGRLDVVRTAIKHQMIYEPDKDHTDYKAQGVLKHLLARTKELLDVLDRIDKQDRTAAVDRLRDDFNRLIRRANIDVFQRTHSNKSSRYDDPDEDSILRYVSNEFLDEFDRLNEDLRAIADLSKSASILDILRLDLWSARPQLYEVWLLVCIVNWIASRGHRIDLLNLQQDEIGRAIWHLSYSKSSQPCICVENDGQSAFIFFQLYRPSGDMPDLCSLSDSTPNAAPLWSIDAKHSEKSGYSVGSYLNTATRYRDSFGAPLSLVVEYFPRMDISIENPVEFGAGISLIKDARPNGVGIALLFQSLSDLYPISGKAVLCIDFSSSFRKRCDQAFQAAIKKIQSMETNVLDSYVCFAGEAITKSGIRNIIFGGAQPVIPDLQLHDGTSIQNVINELKKISATSPITHIIMISDGQFSEPKWMEHLQKESDCIVELYS